MNYFDDVFILVSFTREEVRDWIFNAFYIFRNILYKIINVLITWLDWKKKSL